jgi:subtilisin family serine protease
MKLSKVLAFLLGTCLAATSVAENNKLIVRLKNGEDAAQLQAMGYRNIEVLVQDLNIYSVEVPMSAAREIGTKNIASRLRSYSGVIYAQEDHKITMRKKKYNYFNNQGKAVNPAPVSTGVTPNDKSFADQWDMLSDGSNAGIDALSAWNTYGTGGVDARGADVVVAIVDGGVDITHPDLAQNIWVNKGEIPNNGKDDDGNGYIDDVNGWNAFNNSGKVGSDDHGTHLAGTIGAVGNNGINGAGINWKVKMMVINGSSSSTSVVLKAYGYVLAQKKLWLQSNGQAGANVVVTNSSFGVDYGNCKSSTYAAWNDIYNEMGKYGILHAIATANNKVDVDAKGDVPTGCDSPYIISVTNTQKNGRLYYSAGYGKTTIDLSAPGTDIYSTVPRNGWALMTGTSMATPHVAGAVAYMHSVASKSFNDSYYMDPAAAALRLKQTMLDTVTPVADLDGRTVSGGMLNLNKAAAAISTL